MPAKTEKANPAPLGLVGFGLTTVLLSMINAHWIGAEGVVVPLAIAYGGTIQLFAGILEYGNGNTFGVTAFTSYGAFWWWWALLHIFSATGWISLDGAAHTIGWALILWGIFTTYMWIGTFALNRALWWVFLTLAVTFYLLGFGELLGAPALGTLGGWLGIITGLLAMYTSFGEVVNWSFDGNVIPLGGRPAGPSRGAGPGA